MRKRKTVVLAVLAVVLLAVVIACGISLCMVHTYVYTSSLGVWASGHTYMVSPLLRLKSDGNPEDKTAQESRNNVLHSAILAVSAVDQTVYRDEHVSLDRQVFPIDGQIYYYRENVFDGFFCLDIATETVRKCEFSEYSQYVHVADEEKATVNHIGMRNFIVRNSILAEGLLDQYPSFGTKLQEIGDNFYAPWAFWDNGRIFFVADNTVYEYLPEKDTLKRIVRVGKGETVLDVLDAR